MDIQMKEEVFEIIAGILKIDAASLTEETKIEDIEKWDSLAHLMIIEAIDNKLGKSIPIDKAMEITSVKELLEAVEA